MRLLHNTPFSSRENQHRNILHYLTSAEFKEIAGGVLLLLATIISILWANLPENLSTPYLNFWKTNLGVHFGSYQINLSLQKWVNEGLMTLFFFVIGLEIRREISIGDLSSAKKASLPICAALGGMVFPALFYFFFNRTSEHLLGWGIPTATDIAFVVGILTIFNRKTPPSLLIFLLTLATADDLGAIIIIALFYTSAIHWKYLLASCLLCLCLVLLNYFRIYRILPYGILGFFLWLSLLNSGVNADISGVITAFAIPLYGKIQTAHFVEKVQQLADQFLIHQHNEDEKHFLRSAKQQEILYLLRKEHEFVHSPSQRLIFTLENYTMFLIMPIFALANTAIPLETGDFIKLFSTNVSLGIIMGLIFGKPLGIVLVSKLAMKLGLAVLPEGLKLIHLVIAGCLGGIGFTMSLFISDLSFNTRPEILSLSKLAVMTASSLAAMVGCFLILKLSSSKAKKVKTH